MKYAFYLATVLFVLLSCNQPEDKLEETPPVQLLPQPTALEISIKNALIEILKKQIDPSGSNANAVQITGLEIVKISRKDYLIYEKNSQVEGFDRYLKYMEKYKNISSPIYKPEEIVDNKQKHAAVMEYLDRATKKASEQKDLYKASYYLKADTKNIKYTQLQTTYLDAELKEIVSDYNNLKIK